MDINRFWDEYERLNREVDRRFVARYEGKIEPGVGCVVCPELCAIADLRSIEISEFQARFRREAAAANSELRYHERLLTTRELERLGCIAAAHGRPLTQSLMELLDPSEERATRFEAAQQAVALEIGGDQAQAVLNELTATR
ncbi:hypothetical protein [Haliangium sp.]|uniref:hypothetical protein n=1 Tax=Haliangium sp. TaxID=2663208 RepID=UPI003D0C1353